MRWTICAVLFLLSASVVLAQEADPAQAPSSSGATAQTAPPVGTSTASGMSAGAAPTVGVRATPGTLADDPAPLLGATIAEALARYGAPDSVYAVRGPESWQDDVAFAYAPGFTFFLYGNRLWQLRLAPPYAGSIYGVFLGDNQDKVLSTLGRPYERQSDYFIYRMPYRGYPVMLKLVFDHLKLIDVYLYRADF